MGFARAKVKEGFSQTPCVDGAAPAWQASRQPKRLTAAIDQVWAVLLPPKTPLHPSLAAYLTASDEQTFSQARPGSAAGVALWEQRRALRANLRYILAQAVGGDAASRPVKRARNGAPVLSDTPGLFLSFSHSTDGSGRALGLIGLSSKAPLGVDCQAAPGPERLDALEAACLAPSEARFLSSLRGAERGIAFARMWSAKEAFGKTTGLGLLPSPTTIVTRLTAGSRFKDLYAPGSHAYQVTGADDFAGFAAACCQHSDNPVSFRTLGSTL